MVNRQKRVLSFLIATVMLFSGWVIPNEKAYAGTALPSISKSKYISTYTYASSGKVYAYKDASLKTKTGGYIACATDECRIYEIKGQAVHVSYPVPGNRKDAWFSREAFTYRDLASNGAQLKFKCTKKVTTYKWKNKSNTFGYISSGDTCYLLRGDASSDWLQVIYPVSSGYKMGWVKGADIRTVIWPVTTKITLNTSSVTLNGIGSTTTLRATVTPSNSSQSVSWSSSNNNVATVSGGTVKAVGAGTATITAKSGSKSASASVKVVAGSQPSTPTTVQPTGISLSSSSFTLTKKGATKKITATVSPSNATNKGVTWSSSNTSVATVSGGTVTAKANGSTTITATTCNGKKATCKVNVKISSKLPWPTLVKNTYKGGFSLYEGHNGMDINAKSGSPLYSSFNGKATYYQRYRVIKNKKILVSYGNYVKIVSNDGKYIMLICHMSKFKNVEFKIKNAINAKDYWSVSKYPTLKPASWKSGDKEEKCGKTVNVKIGTLLGYSGGTGRSTGPHLHVTLKVKQSNGKYKLVDPYSYFNSKVCAKDCK